MKKKMVIYVILGLLMAINIKAGFQGQAGDFTLEITDGQNSYYVVNNGTISDYILQVGIVPILNESMSLAPIVISPQQPSGGGGTLGTNEKEEEVLPQQGAKQLEPDQDALIKKYFRWSVIIVLMVLFISFLLITILAVKNRKKKKGEEEQ